MVLLRGRLLQCSITRQVLLGSDRVLLRGRFLQDQTGIYYEVGSFRVLLRGRFLQGSITGMFLQGSITRQVPSGLYYELCSFSVLLRGRFLQNQTGRFLQDPTGFYYEVGSLSQFIKKGRYNISRFCYEISYNTGADTELTTAGANYRGGYRANHRGCQLQWRIQS